MENNLAKDLLLVEVNVTVEEPAYPPLDGQPNPPTGRYG